MDLFLAISQGIGTSLATGMRTFLVPLLVVMHRLSRDRETMGELVVSPGIAVAQVAMVMVCASVGLILVQSL